MFSYLKKLYSLVSNDNSNIIKYEDTKRYDKIQNNINDETEIIDKKQYYYDLYQKSLIELSIISKELLKFENLNLDDKDYLKKLYKLKLEDYDNAFNDMVKYRDMFESL
jgi:hypothetical protein